MIFFFFRRMRELESSSFFVNDWRSQNGQYSFWSFFGTNSFLVPFSTRFSFVDETRDPAVIACFTRRRSLSSFLFRWVSYSISIGYSSSIRYPSWFYFPLEVVLQLENLSKMENFPKRCPISNSSFLKQDSFSSEIFISAFFERGITSWTQVFEWTFLISGEVELDLDRFFRVKGIFYSIVDFLQFATIHGLTRGFSSRLPISLFVWFPRGF